MEMTDVSNACAALTHMTVYSITSTVGYWEGNVRLCTVLMVTSDRNWTLVGKSLKINSFDFDFYIVN